MRDTDTVSTFIPSGSTISATGLPPYVHTVYVDRDTPATERFAYWFIGILMGFGFGVSTAVVIIH